VRLYPVYLKMKSLAVLPSSLSLSKGKERFCSG